MKVIKRNYTGEPDKLILIELGQYCFPLVRISMLPVIPDVVVYGKDYNQGPI